MTLVNKRQIEVQKVLNQEEKKMIQLLKMVYQQAAKDCEMKIRELAGKMTMENLQSVIYQKRYQEAMKKQIDSILDALQVQEFDGIAGYLSGCYEDGFLGALYDLHGQGIPLIFPLDQRQVVKAVQTDSKLSTDLYSRLGEDVKYLKKSIRAELSRGIASGSTWAEMAVHIANGMNSPFRKATNNAMRIARTEGHRIQNEAQMDTMIEAKKRGADVVKQWIATLDDRTRTTHKQLDGQIRELDDYFEVNGNRAKHPGAFHVAKEDIHCRCCMAQRAKWNLDQDELKTLKERAAYFGLDKTADFEDFKKKYLQLPDGADTMDVTKEPSEAYKNLLDGVSNAKVTYRKVEPLRKSLSNDEIINRLGGGDMTNGSCSSLGFAYIGNKNGWDVLDFRDGSSRKFFSRNANIQKVLELPGVKGSIAKVQKEAGDTAKIINGLEQGKEYYLAVGKHAAIVRNTEKGAEYLELQSAINNGWQSFDRYGTIISTLQKRFGCRKTVDKMKIGSQSIIFEKTVVLMEVESFKGNSEFQDILGYINTAVDKQKKGVTGNVK